MKSKFAFAAILIAIIFFSQDATAQSNTDTTVKKIVLTVTNLTCDGDMPTIKKQLLNQDGIESVAFTKRSGGASEFTIHYNAGVINLLQLHKAIESTPGCDDKMATPYRVKKEKNHKEIKQ